MIAMQSPTPSGQCVADPEIAQVQSVVLLDVPWGTYQTLRWGAGNEQLRMTYDGGSLEIMSPLRKHGKMSWLIDHMIFEWVRRHGIKFECGGNLTMSSEDLQKGLEPDLCYWVTHHAAVFGRDEYNSLTDPPPDLALEVDITRNSIPKLPIYQALKIPEVWRWRKRLEILRLNAAGSYEKTGQSSELPGFPIDLAQQFIERRNVADHVMLLEQFAAAIADLPKN
jgi:Uma2 family endonuclease